MVAPETECSEWPRGEPVAQIGQTLIRSVRYSVRRSDDYADRRNRPTGGVNNDPATRPANPQREVFDLFASDRNQALEAIGEIFELKRIAGLDCSACPSSPEHDGSYAVCPRVRTSRQFQAEDKHDITRGSVALERTKLMNKVCRVAMAVATALAGSNVGSARAYQDITIPLPVVVRAKPAGSDPFDAASLIVVARIRERTEVEEVGFEGQSLQKPGGIWTYVRAALLGVVRVNERRPEDPVMAMDTFLIEQMKRKNKPLRFEFGRDYLLLLKPSEQLMLMRVPTSVEPEPYELSTEQGGFEIVKDRLRVIKRGGPLDRYDGRLLHDVLGELGVHNFRRSQG